MLGRLFTSVTKYLRQHRNDFGSVVSRLWSGTRVWLMRQSMAEGCVDEAEHGRKAEHGGRVWWMRQSTEEGYG